MKFKFTYTTFIGCLALCIAISFASSQGRAGSQGWGNTGAPGDQSQTCITCHGNSAAIQVTIGLEITDDDTNVVTGEYVPGETYGFKINIDNAVGDPSAYGFQLLALKAELDESGDESSEYTNLSSNVKKSFASNTNRSYIEHAGPSSVGEFTANWTAPEVGSGPISIYFCGNGVNLNNSTSGDGAACGKIQLEEGIVSSTTALNGATDFKVFPNPTSSLVNLNFTTTKSQTAQFSIVNLAGQTLDSDTVKLTVGDNTISKNLIDYPQGVYFLRIATTEGIISKKIVRQ